MRQEVTLAAIMVAPAIGNKYVCHLSLMRLCQILAWLHINVESVSFMKAFWSAFIISIISVTLSQNLFFIVGLSQYSGLLRINIPCEVAKWMIYFFVLLGTMTLMKIIYISARRFVHKWKRRGQ
ncbi:hypothetical protein AB6825_02510 [Serratia proteamaculans]|uniref:hypothetical protein n=1 Tax=Serratia proteamaculans TaxID=28151 RepID=UPI0039BDC16D